MSTPAGRHFLQIPGPTNVPDRILRAIGRPTVDHRGPEFGRLGNRVLSGLREIFGTRGNVLIFPSSGTGAWEAALVNTVSPGDAVLMCETGHFSSLWSEMARRLGLEVEVIEGDWRTGASPERIEAWLVKDRGPQDQGGRRRAQRDLDRGHEPHRGGARRDGCGGPPGAVAGRHHLLARLHRTTATTNGRRRDGSEARRRG